MARILFVEDDPLVRHGLSRVLQHAGHELRGAGAVEEAMLQFADFDPDLILLDIGLPDGDGVEAARRLRAQGYEGALVFLTAVAEPLQIAQALQHQPQSYLVKPVTGAQLVPAVQAALSADASARAERERLLAALKDSREISAATGILAERLACSVEQAFDQLRRTARSRGEKITVVAAAVIESSRGAKNVAPGELPDRK